METGKEQMINWIKDLWGFPSRLRTIEAELKWLNQYLKSQDPSFFNPLRYVGDFKWMNIAPKKHPNIQLEESLIKEAPRLVNEINKFLKLPGTNSKYKRQWGRISSKDFCLVDLRLLDKDGLSLKLESIFKDLKSKVKRAHKKKRLRILQARYMNVRSEHDNPDGLIGHLEVLY